MRTSKRRIFLAVAFGAQAICAGLASSATTWTGAAGDGLWGNPLNWSTGTVPGFSDVTTFAGSGETIDLGGLTRPASSIRFTGTGYTLSDGTLLIQGNGITSSSGLNHVAANLTGNFVGLSLGLSGNQNTLDVSGAITGSIGISGGALLTGANTYTGPTYASPSLQLAGGGSSLNSQLLTDVLSNFKLDYNSGSINRLSDSSVLRLSQSTFTVGNSGTIPAAESIGTFDLLKSRTTVEVSSGSSTMMLTAAGISRENGATPFFDVQPTLGGTFRAINPPAQIGLGGTLQTPVVPWAIGMLRPATNVTGPLSLMTYDSGPNPNDPSDDIGLRPLVLGEFASSITLDANVRLTSNQIVSASATINSLVLEDAFVPLTNNAALTITSGAILANSSGSNSAPIDLFSGTGTLVVPGEAVFHTSPGPGGAPFRVDVPIVANSLTKSGDGALVLLHPNKLHGDVYANGGTLISSVAGAMGSGTIHLSGASSIRFDTESQSYSSLVLDATSHFTEGGGVMQYVGGGQIEIAAGTTLTLNSLIGEGNAGIVGGGELHITGDSLGYGIQISPDNVTIQLDGILRSIPIQTEGGGSITLTTAINSGSNQYVLSGTGELRGLVIGGRIEPGDNGIGRLTMNSLRSSSLYTPELQAEIAGEVAGVGYDQLALNTSLTLTNRILVIDLINNFTPTLGDQFTIIDDRFTGAISGTFLGLPQSAIFFADGQAFQISYTGGDGNDVVLTAVVPEPAAAVSLFALAAATLRRRRMRQLRRQAVAH